MTSPPPSALRKRHRVIRAALGVLVFTVLSVGFWMAFDERYLAHKDCIDNLINGSCIGPDGANHTPGGMIWVLPAAGFALIALKCLYTFMREWRAYFSRPAPKQNGP